MAVKIFVTGVTGYIIGDASYAIAQAHPDYELTFLVRTQEKADIVKKAYPKAHIVLGDLDNDKLLKEESSKSDIVLHGADASDNEGAARAIRDGLIAGHSKDHPGFYIHTGGTGILTYTDTEAKRVGELSEKLYDDWDGVGEVTSLPDSAFHRNVDKIVLEAGQQHGDVIKTVIVCPPTIYGRGRGPASTRGRQVYEMANFVLKKSITPVLGPGKARWFNVHVADLADVYVSLIEAAAAKNLSSEIWGEKGYIFTENGEHVWADLARAVGKKAVELGFVSSAPEKKITTDEAFEQGGFEGLSWSTNSRAKAIRARKVLGWSPHRPSLLDTIPEILNGEHELLQKK